MTLMAEPPTATRPGSSASRPAPASPAPAAPIPGAPGSSALAAGDVSIKDVADRRELATNTLILEKCQRLAPNVDAAAIAARIGYLEQIVNALPTQTRRTADTDRYQQFSTPPHYGLLAAWVANIQPDDLLLEPSAGVGGLVVHALNAGARVIANELEAKRLKLLEALTFGKVKVLRLFQEDAEQLHNILPGRLNPPSAIQPGAAFDVVLMNPPFSRAAQRLGNKRDTGAAARHVESALKLLKPGGRLVSILPRGMAPNAPAWSLWWTSIARKYTVRANVAIPGDVYRKFGTTFETRLVVIDHAGPTPLGKLTSTEAKSIAEAITLLDPVRLTRGQQPAATAGAGAPVDEFPVDIFEPPTPVAAEPTPPDSAVTVDPSSVAAAEPAPADELTDAVFEPYHPKRVKIAGAQPHPTDLVESAAMASVLPPMPTYQPILPADLITSGALSEAQLEAIVYACQAFEKFLPADDNKPAYRRGFMIGDGTGVGKGREIGAVILESFLRGQIKAVWCSKSAKLIRDARRDWAALGGDPEQIFPLNDYKINEPVTRPDGILFCTYATLRSVGKDDLAPDFDEDSDGGDDNEHQGRLKQLIAWLGKGFDGVIAFDESHSLKNSATIIREK